MKCPRDGAPLADEHIGAEVSVRRYRCFRCEGLWLERGEGHNVQAAAVRKYSAKLARNDVIAAAYEMARQKALPVPSCPRCGKLLDSTEYAYCSQILIDRCAKCHGVWLDRGELEALQQFLQREAQPREEFWPIFLESIVEFGAVAMLS
jgi:Zn-finger nucleic acid-binding protein